jgi:hypothetical protein
LLANRAESAADMEMDRLSIKSMLNRPAPDGLTDGDAIGSIKRNSSVLP